MPQFYGRIRYREMTWDLCPGSKSQLVNLWKKLYLEVGEWSGLGGERHRLHGVQRGAGVAEGQLPRHQIGYLTDTTDLSKKMIRDTAKGSIRADPQQNKCPSVTHSNNVYIVAATAAATNPGDDI